MTRFVLSLTVAIAATVPVSAQQPLTARIDALRMSGGHLPGAYLENPKAAGLNWYFATIGVHALALDGKHDEHVRAYLDKYLATATRAGGAIDDVEDLTKPTQIKWKVADSDDSYTATMLSLACWYAQRNGGVAWFQKNLQALEFQATANLLDNIDSKTKLVNVFNNQSGRAAQIGAAKVPYQSAAYLMDNCEAYRGLMDFADQLKRLKNKEAGKYADGAATIAEGIAGLYDPNTKSFCVGTLDAGPVKFYPHRLVQVAPQVYRVDLGPKTKIWYADAWAHMNAGGDNWSAGQFKDGSNDGAPFMILGYAAALRGDKELAAAHLKYFQATLQQRGTPPRFGNINELGFARRIEYVLNGR